MRLDLCNKSDHAECKLHSAGYQLTINFNQDEKDYYSIEEKVAAFYRTWRGYGRFFMQRDSSCHN